MSYDNFLRDTPFIVANDGKIYCQEGKAWQGDSQLLMGIGVGPIVSLNDNSYMIYNQRCGGTRIIDYDRTHNVLGYNKQVTNIDGHDQHDFAAIASHVEKGRIFVLSRGYSIGEEEQYFLFMSHPASQKETWLKIRSLEDVTQMTYGQVLVVGDYVFCFASSFELGGPTGWKAAIDDLIADPYNYDNWESYSIASNADVFYTYTGQMHASADGKLYLALTWRISGELTTDDNFSDLALLVCPDPINSFGSWTDEAGNAYTLPVTRASANKFYTGTSRFPSDIVADSENNPIVSYYISDDPALYWTNCHFGVSRYADSTWTHNELDTNEFGTWHHNHFRMSINSDNVLEVFAQRNAAEGVGTDTVLCRYQTTDLVHLSSASLTAI